MDDYLHFQGHGSIERYPAKSSVGWVVMHELGHVFSNKLEAMEKGKEVKQKVSYDIDIKGSTPYATGGVTEAEFISEMPYHRYFRYLCEYETLLLRLGHLKKKLFVAKFYGEKGKEKNKSKVKTKEIKDIQKEIENIEKEIEKLKYHLTENRKKIIANGKKIKRKDHAKLLIKDKIRAIDPFLYQRFGFPKVLLFDGFGSAKIIEDALSKVEDRLDGNFSTKESPLVLRYKLGYWLSIQEKARSLSKIARELSDKSEFFPYKVINPKSEYVSVSPKGSDAYGSYKIHIIQVGSNLKIESSEFEDLVSPLNLSGNPKIEGYEIPISEQDSLEDIKDKIKSDTYFTTTNLNISFYGFVEEKYTSKEYEVVANFDASGNLKSGTINGNEAKVLDNTLIELVPRVDGDGFIYYKEGARFKVNYQGNAKEEADIKIFKKPIFITSYIEDGRLIIESNLNLFIQDDNDVFSTLGIISDGKLNILQELSLSKVSVDGKVFQNGGFEVETDNMVLRLYGGEGEEFKIDILKDLEKTESKVKDFLNAYNDFLGFLNSLLSDVDVSAKDKNLQKIRWDITQNIITKNEANLKEIGINKEIENLITLSEPFVRNLLTQVRNDLSSARIRHVFGKIGIGEKDSLLTLNEDYFEKVLSKESDRVFKIIGEEVGKPLSYYLGILTNKDYGRIPQKVEILGKEFNKDAKEIKKEVSVYV